MLTTDSSFRWRLERLHIEHGIYFSSPNEASWFSLQENKASPHKALYLQFIPKKMLWREDDQSSSSYDSQRHVKNEQFKIHVSVRFKPQSKINASSVTHAATLPLHQRLALIRLNHKLDSNSQALSILKDKGEWFKEKWSSLSEDNVDNGYASRSCSKKDESEEQPTLSCGITSIDLDENIVLVIDQTKGLRKFQFDQIFPDSFEQKKVYEYSVHPIICDFLNATNVSCLVFGVTGSGKTYTMFGPEGDTRFRDQRFEGIVPRACAEVFDALNYRSTHLNFDMNAKTSVSYIEIYGDRIGDLLRRGAPCSSNKAASHCFVMNGAAERIVSNVSEVMEALKIGERQKRKAATAMNDRSSRAHSIFIINLTQDCRTTGICRTSKLFLVDLGGCEQTKKSDIASGKSKHFERLKKRTLSNLNTESNLSIHENVLSDDETVDEYSVGFRKSERMREAVNINLGLMSLKACVNALRAGKENKYIPYYQSKLTMMLSTALGGNSKTSVIICAGQEKDVATETIAALKFGQTCGGVSNELQNDSDFMKKILFKIDREISICEKLIREKERWEVQEETRLDILAEEGTLEQKGFGGVETRKTTKLVGAEKERTRLCELLLKREQLTGSKSSKIIQKDDFGGLNMFSELLKDYKDGSERWSATGGWNSNSDQKIERKKFEQMARKSKLVYSGLSA